MISIIKKYVSGFVEDCINVSNLRSLILVLVFAMLITDDIIKTIICGGIYVVGLFIIYIVVDLFYKVKGKVIKK